MYAASFGPVYKSVYKSSRASVPAMKNPVLEGRLRQIESEEKVRRVRAAVILSKRKPKSTRSRAEVIQRMMRRMKQADYAQKREAQRPMYSPSSMRGKLLRPGPQPELSYQT